MKIPHSLRIVILFLRLALGLDFLCLGISATFGTGLRNEFVGSSFGDLYAWLAGVSNANGLQTIFAWIFTIVGACLIIGLVVRLASAIGITLVIVSMIPAMDGGHLSTAQFANDGVIAIICLLILFVANAGTYLGVDQFFHIHLSSKHKE